jgi:hypothetical protein
VSERTGCAGELFGAWIFPKRWSSDRKRHRGLPVWFNLVSMFCAHTSDRRRRSSRSFLSNRRGAQFTCYVSHRDGQVASEGRGSRGRAQGHPGETWPDATKARPRTSASARTTYRPLKPTVARPGPNSSNSRSSISVAGSRNCFRLSSSTQRPSVSKCWSRGSSAMLK